MNVPPQQTREDRLAALQMANVIRFARADIGREIASGERDPVATLEDPPDVLLSMKLERYLRWIPRMGAVRIDRFIDELGTSHDITLRRLGPRRQRAAAMLADIPVVHSRRTRDRRS